MKMNYASTRNACKMCAPLGASLAFRGLEGCIPLIHGSQGCSTYIRRYGISHFREPIDIASSNFTEASAIFGGKDNLCTALDNVKRQYRPRAIGVTSTCLSETIGENVPMYLSQYALSPDSETEIFYASTPSYRGTHIDGYHEAIYAIVSKLVRGETDGAPGSEAVGAEDHINLIGGFVSPEDIRELHEILSSFGVPYTLLPDYSETLDGPSWEDYQRLPEGGTLIEDVKKMGAARGTVYLGKAVANERNAALYLRDRFGVEQRNVFLPVGIQYTDDFFQALEELTGKPTPDKWKKVRGRLVDAYIDGHKYCFGKKAIVYGDEDFVLSLASFLDEIGVIPVIAATGARSASFAERMRLSLRNCRVETEIMDDADFATILERAKKLEVDFVIGSSKGFYLSRNLEVPLVRCGFPIHDRIGGHRILHLGYRGTLNLFDLVCNALMQTKQQSSKIGYSYI